jgi:hypothetical protein
MAVAIGKRAVAAERLVFKSAAKQQRVLSKDSFQKSCEATTALPQKIRFKRAGKQREFSPKDPF